MSLAISVATAEGLVFAADSRQSYRNQKGQSRVGSNSVRKIFKLGERKGIAVTGKAFLQEGGNLKNVSKFVQDFANEHEIKDLSIKETSTKLGNYLDKKYNWKEELDKLPEKIRHDLESKGHELLDLKRKDTYIEFQFKDSQGNKKQGKAGVDMINFIIGGYDETGEHKIFINYIPGELQLKKDSEEKGKEFGANWVGQTDLIQRVVLGFDGRINNTPLTQQVQSNIVKQSLNGLEYNINYGTMTLQDAIDFTVLMIEATEAIQRFSDGIRLDPGAMPGVGGPVDVGVITFEEGFRWVQEKKLEVREYGLQGA